MAFATSEQSAHQSDGDVPRAHCVSRPTVHYGPARPVLPPPGASTINFFAPPGLGPRHNGNNDGDRRPDGAPPRPAKVLVTVGRIHRRGVRVQRIAPPAAAMTATAATPGRGVHPICPVRTSTTRIDRMRRSHEPIPGPQPSSHPPAPRRPRRQPTYSHAVRPRSSQPSPPLHHGPAMPRRQCLKADRGSRPPPAAGHGTDGVLGSCARLGGEQNHEGGLQIAAWFGCGVPGRVSLRPPATTGRRPDPDLAGEVQGLTLYCGPAFTVRVTVRNAPGNASPAR